MKTIIVKWVPEEEWGYGKAMRVIESDHERFYQGTRFDYGFFGIATDEGYTIISLPMNTDQTEWDWTCPKCGLKNLAHRGNCQTCSGARDEVKKEKCWCEKEGHKEVLRRTERPGGLFETGWWCKPKFCPTCGRKMEVDK